MQRNLTSWGTWDPRDDTEVFPGFSFCLIYPIPRGEEANNLETPVDAH